MKKLFLILLLITDLAACDKVPENGDLDGMWQLTSLTDAAGVKSEKSTQGIYWSFQLKMLMIHTSHEELNGFTHDTTARFRKTKDSLIVAPIYIHFYNSDSLITDTSFSAIDGVGLHGTEGRFSIERLNNRRMELKSDFCRLSFRKLGD